MSGGFGLTGGGRFRMDERCKVVGDQWGSGHWVSLGGSPVVGGGWVGNAVGGWAKPGYVRACS